MKITFALVTALASTLPAQVPSDSAIRAIIAARVEAGRFAGVAVGVVGKDGARRTVAYGPNAGVQPFDASTVFEIGSITKTFTTAILADMVQRGEVSLSDPVAKLLPPGTVVPSRDGREITLLDLATQSSGLPSIPTNFAPKDRANPWADYSSQQLYDYLKSYQLTRGIGERYEYSNVGMGLLGFALAQRAGMSYEDLVLARVLKPLQMADTRVTLTPALQRRLAPGHGPDGSVVKNWDLTTLAGAGALRSTIHDMLTYIRANADSSSKPLGAALAMTHGMRHAAGSPAVTIGLGWHRLRTPAGNWIVWHNGGTGGYRSFTGYSEKTGEGIVVLANTANSVDDLGFHLLDPSFPLQPVPKKRTEVSLPEATLERYVGTFDLAPTFAIAITREGAQLFLQATGQPRFPLFAEKEDEFFLKVVDAQVTFTKDSAGVVTGLVLHQNGAHQPAKKRHLAAPTSAAAQDDPCKAVLAPLRARYAPDRRVAVFDVTCARRGDQVVVKGDVDQASARRDVVAAMQAARLGVVVDSVRVLPDPALAETPFGIVKVSVGNVRSTPAHSAELATQVMMGMVVKVLKNQGGWYYVQGPDQYLGWLEGAAMHLTNQAGAEAWQNAPKVIMTEYFGVVRAQPSNASLPVSDAVPGVLFKSNGGRGRWISVETPDGRTGYVERTLVADYAEWKATRSLTAETVEQTAKRFIGVPYLWGGTSPKGMDCSGFTKTVFRLNGMELNRDANQQAEMGIEVSADSGMKRLSKGDLLFFGQKATAERSERITHVAIYLQDQQFIHTPGGSGVRIDSFDPAAPNFNDGLLKSFVRARRVIGQPPTRVQP